MSYGFLLSTVCSSTADAMKLAISSFFPVIMLCGSVWPLEGMPYTWLREVVWYLPQTAGMQVSRSVCSFSECVRVYEMCPCEAGAWRAWRSSMVCSYLQAGHWSS